MKLNRSSIVSLLLCSSLLTALGAVTPPAEKLLPADTVVVITTPDYAKIREAHKQSPSFQLWNDPSMKPFKDKFMAKLQSDVITPLEREFGVKFADYDGLAQGQVTLALTLNGWDGKNDKPPGFLLLLDAKDKSETLKKNLADLKKKWTDNGKQMRTEKIRDLEFTALIFSSDDFSKTLDKAFPKSKDKEDAEEKPKKSSTKEEWFVGQSDTLLIVGNVAQNIEKVLAHQTGGSAPSLADQNAFANSYGKYFRDNQAYAWVDLKTLIDNGMKSAAAEQTPSPVGGSIEKILKVLGLGGLEALAVSYNQASDGCSAALHIQAPEAKREGLLKILAFQSKDANPPSFVPADAVKFTRFRLNLQNVYYRTELMVGQIDSQYASLLKTMVDLAGKDKDPKFDLRTQLIDNLGDDIISYEKLPRDKTLEDIASPPSITLIGSRKPEQLASAIGSLISFLPAGNTGAKIKEREFLGRKIYTLSLGTVTRDGKRSDSSLYYAPSGGYVAITTDLPMLEEYLRGNSGKSLAEAPGMAEAAQKVGGMNTGLFSYQNQKEITRVAFQTLKKESASLASLFAPGTIAGPLGMDGSDSKLKEWLDFSLLPPFEQIGKYFGIAVWSGAVTPDGFSFKMFGPTPPESRK